MASRGRLYTKAPIGWARFDDTNVNRVPPPYLPLVFWIRPVIGGPYRVDLRDLCERGDRDYERDARRTNDVRGRDAFTRGFALSLCQDRAAHPTYLARRYALRTFFRFLTDVDPEGQECFPELLTDDMGLRLQSWLEVRGSKEYGVIRSVVVRIRAVTPTMLPSVPPLFWPSQPPVEQGKQKDVKLLAVQRLNMAMVKEAMDIKAMFKEGDKLASAGTDPRADRQGASADAWEAPENHAWLARKLLFASGPDDPEPTIAFFGPEHGPSYLAPGMKPLQGQWLGRKQRWFTFGRRDAMVFLWLFL